MSRCSLNVCPDPLLAAFCALLSYFSIQKTPSSPFISCGQTWPNTCRNLITLISSQQSRGGFGSTHQVRVSEWLEGRERAREGVSQNTPGAHFHTNQHDSDFLEVRLRDVGGKIFTCIRTQTGDQKIMGHMDVSQTSRTFLIYIYIYIRKKWLMVVSAIHNIITDHYLNQGTGLFKGKLHCIQAVQPM